MYPPSLSLLDDVPVFTEEPFSVVQKLGGSVTLRCSALPNHVNISWRLNGRELPAGGDEELGVLVRPGSLYIPSLTNLTVGRYQCVATTSVGSCASVPANVTAASEYTHFCKRQLLGTLKIFCAELKGLYSVWLCSRPSSSAGVCVYVFCVFALS